MSVVSLVCCLLLAAVLLWAAAQKAVPSNPLGETATRLGLGTASRPIARMVILSECGAAFLLLSPWPALGAALAALLGTSFAAAGAYVLRRGWTVECACFGGSARALGWPQVLAWPAWLVAAALAATSPALSPIWAALFATLLLLSNVAWRLHAISTAMRAVRWDRLSVPNY